MSSMKVKYIRVGSGPIGGLGFTRMSPQINKIINQELSTAGEAGLGEAQGFIDIAGTANEWSGFFKDLHQGGGVRGKSGRARRNTGAMRDALDFRGVKGSAFGVGLDIGWLNKYEDYMGAQDAGFTHSGYRKENLQVKGMGMFQHLRVYMRGKVSDAADRVMERVTSGL